jgi:ABC-2 type transport system permease protein
VVAVSLVGVELLKLRTVRLPLGLLVTAAALTALFASLEAARAGHSGSGIGSLATAPGLSAVTTLTGWSMLLAAVLGVTVSAGEFRHGTATLTCLATPGRRRVLAAKAVAVGCAGALFGLAAAVIATGAGLAFAAIRGYHLATGAGTLAGHAAGAVLGAALLAVAGTGTGALARSQLAGTVAVLVWSLVAEPVLGGIYPAIHPYLPYTAATTLAGAGLGAGPGGFRLAVRAHASPAAMPLPFAAAAAVLAAVAILICVIAAQTTTRRDIT